MRLLPSFALLICLALATLEARAQNGPHDGTIIAIDGGDLILDVGAARGVHVGDLVELWRPLRLRHPVTGQAIVDRFRIGSLRLTQVRGVVSLATVEGTPMRAPATGDIVTLPEDTPRTPPKPPEAAALIPPNAPPDDPDAASLGKLMTALTGATPELRARSYDAFAKNHPQSRFVNVLREEAQALRPTAAPMPAPAPFMKSPPRLDRVRIGEPQRFAVELDARFVGGVVHVRPKGAPGYHSLPMQSIGPRYFATTLPADAMGAHGMEYFVEGIPAAGEPVALVGTAAEPRDVEVEPPKEYKPRPRESLGQVSLQSEYASFNTKKMNDYVFQTEGSVGWRLADVGLRAVRSGFGVLRGEGGSLNNLDTLNLPPDKVGLTYGYLETELAFASSYAIVLRPILGLREEGITGGFAGFFRIGNDLRTNLLVGGEILGGVGQRGIVELDWRTIKRVPIVLRSEVTTQPSTSGDIGARAIAQVGYEFLPSLVVAIRGSYQGRTINHAGPGGGLAVSYQW